MSKSRTSDPTTYIKPIIQSGHNENAGDKVCELPNYIPHTTPRDANRYEWHNAYISQLIDIRDIVSDVIADRHPKNTIDWEGNDKIFHNLSRIVYHCSSKYITPYLNIPEVSSPTLHEYLDLKQDSSASYND